MKKLAVVLILIISTCLLGGCWDWHEISDLAIVLGTGIDWTSDNKIRLTVQIARPSAFIGGGQKGGSNLEPPSWVVSAEGETIEDAENNLGMLVPRHIYWSHNIILVIGEEMARKGTSLATNYFQRSTKFRQNIWLIVTKGEAKKLLETHSELEKTSAQAIGHLMIMYNGGSITLKDFAETLGSKGINPSVPLVGTINIGVTPEPGKETTLQVHDEIILSGTAIFKKDKLVNFLDIYETQGLIWLKGTIIKEVITIPSPAEPDKLVTIRLRKNSIKVTPDYDGKHIRFDVKLKVFGNLSEQQSRENLATPENIKVLENEASAEIKKRALLALNKIQKKFRSDVLGYGDAFHRKYKKAWKNFSDNWNEEFAKSDVNITVEAHVQHTGLLTQRGSTKKK